MDVRNPANPQDAMHYTTERLRRDFLVQELFVPGQVKMVYSHFDRMIAGGACPTGKLALEGSKELAVEYFLQRREIGIINIGPAGKVVVDGTEYKLAKSDGLYIGMGARDVAFYSDDPAQPAKFYFVSAPAHKTYPTTKILLSDIKPAELGSISQSNERKIYKYIVPGGVQSCQLVMGMTCLAPGNMWNSMPCHTHERRMEIYFYFDMPADAVVFHMMGEPEETRHVIIRNEEAVISPSWSIHCGVGTSNYTFIWGMGGENQSFDDMDHVPMTKLK